MVQTKVIEIVGQDENEETIIHKFIYLTGGVVFDRAGVTTS